MSKISIYQYFKIIPALIMMVLIFMFSAKQSNQSLTMSSGIVNKLIETVETIGGFTLTEEEFIEWTDVIHTPIRKMAHMAEYAVLAITVAYAIMSLFQLYGVRLILYTEWFCMMYAATDEFHQLFVPGRSGEFGDIIIDSCGALIGVLLFCGIYHIIKKRKKGNVQGMQSDT